jgi:hypothetical protein
VDTDRNPFTGGGRGDELLVLTNGEATFSGTDLTFVLRRADLRTRSFNFAVASLRQHADLAPGGGVAKYPRTSSAS